MKAKITNKTLAKIKAENKQYEIRDTEVKGFAIRVYKSGKAAFVIWYGRGKAMTIGDVNVLTPTQARNKAKKIIADVLDGVDPQAAKKKTKAHDFKSFLLNKYTPWVEEHHRNGQKTMKRLEANFLPIIGKNKLDDIKPFAIENWRRKKIKDGRKPATANRDINALKAALQRAVNWGLIESNPLTTIKPLKIDNNPNVRYLTDNEEKGLRKALDAREKRLGTDYLKPMVILSLNTGLRRGEMLNLEWQDINFNQSLLTIRGQAAKSGQTRHIPLNDEALETIKQWQLFCNGNKLVFPSKNGIKIQNVNSPWRKLIKTAGISDFRFHDLRHSFASKLVMAGVDLNTVRELLGHADIKMTLRYAHLSTEVKAAAVQKLVRAETQEKQNDFAMIELKNA